MLQIQHDFENSFWRVILVRMTGESHAGGHFYLGNQDDTTDPPNGPILNTTGILANVMSATSEAEAAALFTNMKEGVIQCIALEEMQWPQPPTPITVDNSTAAGNRTSAGHHQGQQVLGYGHAPTLDTRQDPTEPVLSYLGPRQT